MQDHYSRDRSADDHIESLLEGFEILKETFADDVTAIGLIDEQIEEAKSWASENDREITRMPPRTLGAAAIVERQQGHRSIFDDVDQ